VRCVRSAQYIASLDGLQNFSTAPAPIQILTANIGCQTHLQAATRLPVRHWIEAVDDLLSATPAAS